MPVHEDLAVAWRGFVDAAMDALEPVAEAAHRRERSCRQRHAADAESTVIAHDPFEFRYVPDERGLVEAKHADQPLRADALPPVERAEGIVAAIHAARASALDDAPDRRPELHSQLNDVRESLALVPEALTVAGLVAAVRHYHRPVVARAFGVGPAASLPDDRHRVELSNPDVTGLLTNDVARVPYRDPELALVVPAGDDLDVAYVVGRDDSETGFFAHEVDAVELDPEQAVSRDQLLDALGFDRGLRPDERRLEAVTGERVRLQGDLTIEPVETDEEPVESLIPSRSTIKNEIVESRVKDYLADAYPEGFAAAFDVRTPRRRGRYNFRVHRDEDCTTTASAVRMMERALGLDDDRSLPLDDVSRETTNSRYSALQRLVEQDVADHLEEIAAEIAEEVDRRREHHRERVVREMGQFNLPVDNHLVIAEQATLHGRSSRDEEPIAVVVPEETTLHVLHEEHAQVDIRLSPGVYRLFLLPRGMRRRRRDRPDW